MIKTAVFVAAGLGIRLKEKTKYTPKGLIKLHGKSMMQRSVEKLIEAGIEHIYIGTGYLSEQYDDFAKNYPQIKTIKSEKYDTTGSMYTLYNMKNFIKEDFLLLESDLLYEKKAIDEILKTQQQNVILASSKSNNGDEYFIEIDRHGNFQKVSNNQNDLKNIFGEWVGICKIGITNYNNMCENFIAQKNQKINYEYIINNICKNHHFFVKKIENLVWCEIDDKHQLKNAAEKIISKI